KALGLGGRSLLNIGGGPAGLFDLFACRFGKAMCRDLERFRLVAVAQDHEVVLCLFDKAALVKHLGRDLISRLKVRFDLCEADLDPLLFEDIRKAALRQTTLKRHLAAFKTGTAAVARTRFLALVSAPGGLAKARSGAASDALFLMGRTLCRLQII